MAFTNSSSSAPATTPTAPPLSSSLDTDPHTPLPHDPPLMPRAAPTPLHSDGLNLFGSDFSACPSLPILPISTAPPPSAPAQPLPVAPTQPINIRDVRITDHINFKVTTSGSNLTRWRQTITFLLTMYNALDHVTEGAAPANPNDEWRAADIHISLWFMATLADDLLRLVQGPDGRASTTWTRLHNFFYTNRSSRYVYLSQAFRNTPRGDMGIATYTSRLRKSLTTSPTSATPSPTRNSHFSSSSASTASISCSTN